MIIWLYRGGGGGWGGGIKVIVWREDERVSQKVKGELALFMGELTTQVFFQNYLPISASFGLKRVI